MADNIFNRYDLGPKVVAGKPKYRDEVKSKKLTYNFVTDPRLKRGHNFGVIYVSNTNYDEEGAKKQMERNVNQINQQRYALRKLDDRSQYDTQKISGLDENYKDFGIATDIPTTTAMPKPITFEVEVQTDPLPPKEQEKFLWPEQKGIEKGTQIEDNDQLFIFDREVKPLVQIIVSKTLEESRREVLEEEEINQINKSMEKYKQFNKEDADRVRNLVENEQKKFEERIRRKEDKKKRVELAKVFQKKLLCRTISKSYLQNLFNSSIKSLGKRGGFKAQEVDEYFTILLPDLFKITEEEKENDYKYSGGFTDMFNRALKNKNINTHREAIRKEKERKEKEKQDYLDRKKREAEEKERQKEERRRRRHERKVNELRKAIQEELMPNNEWVEDILDNNVYDINGYYSKNKCVTTVGGPIGQMAIALCLLNKYADNAPVTEKMIKKIVDLYMNNSHPFYLVYKQDDVEEYKSYVDDFNAIEDIRNAKKFKTLTNKIYENQKQIDDMLPFIFDICVNTMQYENFEKFYKKIFTTILNKFKDGDETLKFLAIDPATEEIPLHAIIVVNGDKEKIVNPNEPAPDAPKPEAYEPFFSERTLVFPTFSDKLKIIAINKNFDRIFRENFYNCVSKVCAFESEREDLFGDIDKEYDAFVGQLLIKLAETYQKEAFEMAVSLPKEGGAEEEEKEEDDGGDKEK